MPVVGFRVDRTAQRAVTAGIPLLGPDAERAAIGRHAEAEIVEMRPVPLPEGGAGHRIIVEKQAERATLPIGTDHLRVRIAGLAGRVDSVRGIAVAQTAMRRVRGHDDVDLRIGRREAASIRRLEQESQRHQMHDCAPLPLLAQRVGLLSKPSAVQMIGEAPRVMPTARFSISRSAASAPFIE